MTNSASSSVDNSQFYAHIFERMVDDASFLWLLRALAVDRPNYNHEDLAELDQRIQAQLDGLMSAPEQSWAFCVTALELLQPGEMFTAAMLAFSSLDVKKIQHVVEVAVAEPITIPGLISALAWQPAKHVDAWIRKFLTSKDINHKLIGIWALSLRREDPRELLAKLLERKDCIANQQLYARSLRMIGELKRRDLVAHLAPAMESEHPGVQFWAIWSALMLGDKTVTQKLLPFVLNENEFQKKSIDIAFRVLTVGEARQWIGELAKTPSNIRQVIQATAVLGDPHAIDWLIQHMATPLTTRLAGEAFSIITGIDLEEHKLDLDDLPELDNLLADDDAANDSIELDDDEYLPFPDMDKIAAVWQKYRQRFVAGQRYFLGKLISINHLNHIYGQGNQRQRRSAALEQALLQRDHYMLNHAARRTN